MEKLLKRAFVNESSRTAHVVNDVLAVVTVVSILSLVLETVSSLSNFQTIFVAVEWIAVAIFGIEYIGRTYVSKPTWKYMLSFYGVIDLVAIAPTFLGIGNLTFLKSARALRIIRMLRMLRLAKMGRSGVLREESVGVLGLNVSIYFATLVFALLITGTAMYLVEPNSTVFSSIPAGMWWSLKVFMAGIPVTEPVTALGEVFFVLTRFVGLLLLGLLIGVVGNVFKTLLLGNKS